MYQRVLFPTDGDTSDRALEHAVDLARTYDAELHVLYVVDETIFEGDVGSESLAEQFESTGESIVERVSGRVREAGLDRVRTDVVRGTPHEAIIEHASDRDVDVIVMGTSGRTGLDRYLLGSVTEKVVRLADRPVLTVREPAES